MSNLTAKIEEALNAIERVASDASVDPQETRDALLELRDMIDCALDALYDDIEGAH